MRGLPPMSRALQKVGKCGLTDIGCCLSGEECREVYEAVLKLQAALGKRSLELAAALRAATPKREEEG